MKKESLMKKSKKELVNMILFKEEIKDYRLTINAYGEEILSIPIKKGWNALTTAFYFKNEEGRIKIDEVALWNRHVIDDMKKAKNKNIRKRLLQWWKL